MFRQTLIFWAILAEYSHCPLTTLRGRCSSWLWRSNNTRLCYHLIINQITKFSKFFGWIFAKVMKYSRISGAGKNRTAIVSVSAITYWHPSMIHLPLRKKDLKMDFSDSLWGVKLQRVDTERIGIFVWGKTTHTKNVNYCVSDYCNFTRTLTLCIV